MNTHGWKQIWECRTPPLDNVLDLGTLIKLDGFDMGAGRIEVTDWQSYANLIAQRLALKDGDSVYELGCGAGAFLFALRQFHTLKIGGLDYSTTLIETALRAMPDGDFIVNEAKFLEKDNNYDYVISNSVFHYFTHDYAADVITSMVMKSNIAVAIMEIPDLKTKLESESLRRDSLSVESYEKKYAGLVHTYYDRDWFKQQASMNGCTCEVFDGCVPNYAQNIYRFGVVIRKS